MGRIICSFIGHRWSYFSDRRFCTRCELTWWFRNAADLDRLRAVTDELWDSLGSGDWLPPGDYEALRERYNRTAQAAEDVCTLSRRAIGAGR